MKKLSSSTRYLWYGLIIILNVSSVKVSWAQDIHFSQFYNSPLNLNPSNAGIFNGDQRVLASYRDQWRSVPVPWTTVSLSYDQKFYPKLSDKYFFSGGILFNYDRQGLSKLNLSNLNLLASYTRVLNENNLITIGALVGFATRGFSPNSLTWDQQWTGDIFDPGLPSGETFDAERINFLENAVGVSYRWQQSSRTKLDVGVGVFHIYEPRVAFFGSDDMKLPRRMSFTAIGSVELLDALDIQLQGIAQIQSDYNEYLFGALGKIYVDKQRGKEFEFHLGLGYRTTNSIVPVVAVQLRNIYASFSYDIDMSEFEQFTKNKGGPELHFNYIITNVKPPKNFKVCPIF